MSETLYIPNDPNTIPGIRHRSAFFRGYLAFPITDVISVEDNIAHVKVKRSESDTVNVQIYPGELSDEIGQPLKLKNFDLLEQLYPQRKDQQQ